MIIVSTRTSGLFVIEGDQGAQEKSCTAAGHCGEPGPPGRPSSTLEAFHHSCFSRCGQKALRLQLAKSGDAQHSKTVGSLL